MKWLSSVVFASAPNFGMRAFARSTRLRQAWGCRSLSAPSDRFLELTVERQADIGCRLDQWLASELDVSRSQIPRLIKSGRVVMVAAASHDTGTTAAAKIRPGRRISSGDIFRIQLADEQANADNDHTDTTSPTLPPIGVLFEDESILVVDKPAGLVVHPSTSSSTDTSALSLRGSSPPTLCDWALDRLDGPPWPSSGGDSSRPGIVHRLDAGTSGVMVLAKTQRALGLLAGQFARREARRAYLTVVWGDVEASHGDHGTIDKPVRRHSRHWLRFAVAHSAAEEQNRAGLGGTGADDNDGGGGGGPIKRAVTHWRALARGSFASSSTVSGGRRGKNKNKTGHLTLLECQLETGRTHQIRVHASSCLGHPVVGDLLYTRPRYRPRPVDSDGNDCGEPSGLSSFGPAGSRQSLAGALAQVDHQLLHAGRLGVVHPETQEWMYWESPPPPDFSAVLRAASMDWEWGWDM